MHTLTPPLSRGGPVTSRLSVCFSAVSLPPHTHTNTLTERRFRPYRSHCNIQRTHLHHLPARLLPVFPRYPPHAGVGVGRKSIGGGRLSTAPSDRQSIGAGRQSIGAGRQSIGAGRQSIGAGRQSIGRPSMGGRASTGGRVSMSGGGGKNRSVWEEIQCSLHIRALPHCH